jgi:uncharacterized repeat protein (TIGR03987 family)
MNIVLLSVVFIVAAFLLYPLAVWSERFAARLKPWHLVVFWLGFIADTAGTSLMARIAQAGPPDPDFVMAVHGITGMLALMLMFFHSAWASVVLVRKDEKAILNFHRLSTAVWAIWLIPFFIGGAMQGFR